MMTNNYRRCYSGAGQALVLVAGLMIIVGQVAAAPIAGSESAVIKTRIFNDDPDSTVTFGDSYPASIFIQDAVLDGGNGGTTGFANLHNWRFSENDFTAALFNNADSYSYSSDLVISGAGNGEAGLSLSPWWSQDVDGRLNVRSTDGEIAAFGGRLPFFSFTGSFGINYAKGDTINLGVDYKANGLSLLDPATVEYLVSYNGTDYTSGPLNFDEGNPAEGFGSWGALDSAQAGGYMQAFIDIGNPSNLLRAEWGSIAYAPEPASLSLLVLGGLAMVRRRR